MAAPEASLIEAARAAGLRLPSACRNGTCRACLAQLLDGAVQYRIEWPGLSREEHAQGLVLPCVALARSDLQLAAEPMAPPSQTQRRSTT